MVPQLPSQFGVRSFLGSFVPGVLFWGAVTFSHWMTLWQMSRELQSDIVLGGVAFIGIYVTGEIIAGGSVPLLLYIRNMVHGWLTVLHVPVWLVSRITKKPHVWPENGAIVDPNPRYLAREQMRKALGEKSERLLDWEIDTIVEQAVVAQIREPECASLQVRAELMGNCAAAFLLGAFFQLGAVVVYSSEYSWKLNGNVANALLLLSALCCYVANRLYRRRRLCIFAIAVSQLDWQSVADGVGCSRRVAKKNVESAELV